MEETIDDSYERVYNKYGIDRQYYFALRDFKFFMKSGLYLNILLDWKFIWDIRILADHRAFESYVKIIFTNNWFMKEYFFFLEI